MIDHRPGRPRRRWRHRVLLAMVLAMVATGSVEGIAPAPARADEPEIIRDCGLGWTGHKEFVPGEEHVNCNGYKLTFQFDGNVVIYNLSGGPIWAAGSNHSPAGKLVFEAGPGGDGNLVVYKPTGEPVWATNKSAPGGRLEFDAGGHLAVYNTGDTFPVFSAPAMPPMSPPPATPIEMQTTVTNADGRAEVFGIDADGRMWHRWQGCNGQPNTNCGGWSTTWSDWALLGGQFVSPPVVIQGRRFGDLQGHWFHYLHVFAVGTDGALWYTRQVTQPGVIPVPGTTYKPWVSLGGVLVSKPGAVLNSDGRVEVFAVGTDHAMYHTWVTCTGAPLLVNVCSTWSGWHGLGGSFSSEPTAAAGAPGLHVFARGLDGSVYYARQTTPERSDAYTGWTSLGGQAVGAPAAGSDSRIALFVRGTDNALWINQQTCTICTTWTGWRSLGGNLNSPPVVKLSTGAPGIQAFTVWGDGEVRYSAPVVSNGPAWQWFELPEDHTPHNPYADICLPVSAAAREMGMGCTPLDPYPEDGNRAAPPPPNPPRGHISWVALGDSFTSGTAAGGYAKLRDQFGNLTRHDPCYRSSNNYANQVMRGAKEAYNYAYVSGFTAACHGAETHHILGTNIDGGRPQISYVDHSVDVVFLTIGGNDLGFGPKLRRCIQQDCTVGGAPLVTQVELEGVRARLVTVYKRLREKMRPDAILQVSTYPQIFPPMTDSNTGSYDTSRCNTIITGALADRIEPAEMKLIHEAWQRARIMIADAVSRANNVAVVDGINAKAQLADMYDKFKDHDICADRPWATGIAVTDLSTSFHPNERGHFTEALHLANGFMHWPRWQSH